MSISKIFTPNFLCVLTNERYKLYQTGFSFCHTGHVPGWAGGAQGVKKIFFKHGHVAYHIDRDDKQNKMQVTFSSKGQNGDLRVRSKGQISLNFRYHVNFNYLYQTLCVFSQIKDRKHIEQNFHSVARIMGQGRNLGCWGGGVKNFSVGIRDGAPSTVHSSDNICRLLITFTNSCTQISADRSRTKHPMPFLTPRTKHPTKICQHGQNIPCCFCYPGHNIPCCFCHPGHNIPCHFCHPGQNIPHSDCSFRASLIWDLHLLLHELAVNALVRLFK